MLKVCMNFDLIFEFIRDEETSAKGRKKKVGTAHGIKFERF